MIIHHRPRRTLPLLALGLLATATTAGCANGLVTTNPGADPSLSSPVASASPSASADASTSPSSPAISASASSSSSGPASGPATAKPTGGSASANGSRVCTTGDLDIGISDSAGGGAAGSNYVLLTFRNHRSGSCTLYGYPGVSFVGKGNGTQLGVPAVRTDSPTPKTVKLSAGATTTALLRIVNTGVYDATTCAPTTADGLRVYPPGSKDAAYVAFKASACQKDPGSSKQLSISPVGTSG